MRGENKASGGRFKQMTSIGGHRGIPLFTTVYYLLCIQVDVGGFTKALPDELKAKRQLSSALLTLEPGVFLDRLGGSEHAIRGATVPEMCLFECERDDRLSVDAWQRLKRMRRTTRDVRKSRPVRMKMRSDWNWRDTVVWAVQSGGAVLLAMLLRVVEDSPEQIAEKRFRRL